MKLKVVKLGLMEYGEALELQQKIQKLSQKNKIGNVLLLLEHPSVITIGTNGKNNNNLLVNEEMLRSKNVSIYRCNRGGDITYHGPGQIVGYPILNLNQFNKDVRDYIRKLEEVFIRILAEEYGIGANRISGSPGVWIGDNKITAIGCSIKRWVTMHGFGFNVNTNLNHFKWINPCGYTDKGVTSLQYELNSVMDIDDVMDLVIKHFKNVFEIKTKIMSKESILKEMEESSNEQI